MSVLPPGTGSELATKTDIAQLRAELRAEIVALREALQAQGRTFVIYTGTLMAGLVGISLGAQARWF